MSTTVADALDRLTSAIGGGGGAGDNGVMVVTCNNDSGIKAVDKTLDEIKAVINSGGYVVARYRTISNQPYIYYQLYADYDDSVAFYYTSVEPNRVGSSFFSVDANGASEVRNYYYPQNSQGGSGDSGDIS